MNSLVKAYYWLWLDWHGYCPKHLMPRTSRFRGVNIRKRCPDCKAEERELAQATASITVARCNAVCDLLRSEREAV